VCRSVVRGPVDISGDKGLEIGASVLLVYCFIRSLDWERRGGAGGGGRGTGRKGKRTCKMGVSYLAASARSTS
jgi:hypothetical protein